MYQNINLKSRWESLLWWGRENEKSLLVGLALTLGFLTGLGTGLLMNTNRVSPIIIDKNIKIGLPNGRIENSSTPLKKATSGNFMASINGKSYYPANCEAAKRIKEENRIWFGSREEAEAGGYKPAKNCF